MHAFFHGEVDYGLVFAVVDAGESGEVALAVDDLEFLNHVHGQVLGGHFGIVGEEFFAVDEYFCDFFAVVGDFSFGVDFYAGEAFKQVLDHGVGLCLVGVGVEFDGVFHHLYGCLDAHYGGFFEGDGVFLHLYGACGKVFAVDAHGTVYGVVAYVGGFEDVSSVFDVGECEAAVVVGEHAFYGC